MCTWQFAGQQEPCLLHFCLQSENIPNFRGTDRAIVKGIPRNVRPGYHAEMFGCYGVCSNICVSSENDTYRRMPKQEESKFRAYVQQGRQYPLHTDRRPCLLQLCLQLPLHFYLFHLNRAFGEDCCCCRSNKLIHKNSVNQKI